MLKIALFLILAAANGAATVLDVNGGGIQDVPPCVNGGCLEEITDNMLLLALKVQVKHSDEAVTDSVEDAAPEANTHVEEVGMDAEDIGEGEDAEDSGEGEDAEDSGEGRDMDAASAGSEAHVEAEDDEAVDDEDGDPESADEKSEDAPDVEDCGAVSPQTPDFVAKFRPCGEYIAKCSHLPVLYANMDYPGSGEAGVLKHDDYIVQFDGKFGVQTEVCLEVVIRGHSDWGNLGLTNTNIKETSYDCMGRCGAGCAFFSSSSGGKDCLKHDVCSAYKSFVQKEQATGFCDDSDCGDEGAQSLFNCREWSWLKQILGAPAICTQGEDTTGKFSAGNWFFPEGDCKKYQGWGEGQGIPA